MQLWGLFSVPTTKQYRQKGLMRHFLPGTLRRHSCLKYPVLTSATLCSECCHLCRRSRSEIYSTFPPTQHPPAPRLSPSVLDSLTFGGNLKSSLVPSLRRACRGAEKGVPVGTEVGEFWGKGRTPLQRLRGMRAKPGTPVEPQMDQRKLKWKPQSSSQSNHCTCSVPRPQLPLARELQTQCDRAQSQDPVKEAALYQARETEDCT